MSNNDNQNKKPSSLPEGLSSIADDEAITEIDFTDFLEENSKSSALFEGFHEDIEKTEKSLENELQSLYDDIMGSGPETIVPKPLSVLTSSEAEPKKVALSDPQLPDESKNSSLDDLWMNPEDYFDDDIPVVSLDEDNGGKAQTPAKEKLPEEAIFNPAAPAEQEDAEKNDIFSMIDMLKAETDSETGFDDILSEIESNKEIAPVDTELSSAAELVTTPAPAPESDYEETVPDDDINWDELEITDEEAESPAPAEPEQGQTQELPVIDANPDQAPIDTSSEDFDRELAELLGDVPPVSASAAEAAPAATGFVINVPDDGNDYDAAAAAPEKLYQAAPMGTKTLDDDPDLDDGDGKSEKGGKNGGSGKKASGAGEVIRKIVLSLSIITIIVSCGILVNTYFIEPFRFKSKSEDLAQQMSENINQHSDSNVIDEKVKSENPNVNYPDGMLAKYAQLYAANSDLAGWISIPGLEINLPIAQTDDNEYYLKKDIYGKYTSYGVPFFDYRMDDLRNLPKNTVVYGHNMRHDDYIFGMLENYREIEGGFAQAPVIECNTIYGDHTWFVYAVYITNSKASQDNGYLFPYNFINVGTAKFADYIKEIDKRKLYTTGVDINENDRILTLSTCCYDFDGARLVVVAREKRDGESVSVDASRAYYNENPKYPQAWYDANKKTNPYAEDARW